MLSEMKGKLVIFSAPSGSGKTTIVKRIIEMGVNLEFSISACTRKPRGSEEDGKDYYFLSPDTFRKKIENREFIEWEEVYENQYYGTLKSEMKRLWDQGKNIIFDIDVKGGVNLKKQFGKDALALFIKAPSIEELERRLRNRKTDSEDSIQKRLKKASYELTFEHKFDKVIINDNLDMAIVETYQTVNNFLQNGK